MNKIERDRILIADDDELIIKVLQKELEREGYRVIACYDGEAALELARAELPDLILLDGMMPKRSGWEVCRELRAEMTTPIIMLSARGEEMDKVTGLKVGADDYIAKPFGLLELLARVDANLRRAKIYQEDATDHEESVRLYPYGELMIDMTRCIVKRNGESIPLTSKEFDLLDALLIADGAVIQRNDLLDIVWGVDWIGDTRTLDVHISRLRNKLEEDATHPQFILTARGIGYRMQTVKEFEAQSSDERDHPL